MNLLIKLYVGTVIAAGAMVLATLAPRHIDNPALAATLLGAMLVASVFKLRIPIGQGPATMSMAYVIDFVAMLTVGVDVAMAIAAIGVLVQCTVRVRRRQPWYRAAFSIATVAMSVQAAGWTWATLGNGQAASGLVGTVVPFAGAVAAYFAINTTLIAAAIALSTRRHALTCWRAHFVRTAPGYLLSGTLIATIHGAMAGQTVLLLSGAAVPMLLGYVVYDYWFRQLHQRQPAVAPVVT